MQAKTNGSNGSDPNRKKGRVVRCAIYIRTATNNTEQATRQRAIVSAFLQRQAKHGWHAVETRYEDFAMSGNAESRPALDRLLADATAGRIDRVIVIDLLRLARNMALLMKLMDRFARCGVEVSVADERMSPEQIEYFMTRVAPIFARS